MGEMQRDLKFCNWKENLQQEILPVYLFIQRQLSKPRSCRGIMYITFLSTLDLKKLQSKKIFIKSPVNLSQLKTKPLADLLFFLPKGSGKCLKSAEIQSTSLPFLIITGPQKKQKQTSNSNHTLILPFKHSSSNIGIFRVNYTKMNSDKCIFNMLLIVLNN